MADTSFMRWALRQFYTKTQLANDALDAYYFGEDEFISTSAGAGDAGKPIVLDAGGKVDASMINDADIDHGTTTGLTDDDHSQYALLAGRSGGQVLYGGTAASNTITIEGTSNATKGYVLLNPNGSRVGIGTSSPSATLDIYNSTNGTNAMSMDNPSDGTSATTSITLAAATTNRASGTIQIFGHDYSTAVVAGRLVIQSNSNSLGTSLRSTTSGQTIDFYAGNTTKRVEITSTGMDVTGTLTVGGVTVPTISSTSTLTNKTLTSPTINGATIGTSTINSPTINTPTIGTSATVPLIYGSSSANGDITIHGTSSATRATSYVLLQPSGGGVGIGLTDPGGNNLVIAEGDQFVIFDCDGGTGGTPTIVAYDNSGATTTDLEIAADVLYLNPNTKGLRLGAITTVSTASETGTAGTMCFDSSYVYFCVATDTWVRAALATW